MNLYAKTALLACGVAVASSAITMLAVNSIDSTDSVAQSVTALFNEDGTSHSGGAFYTVANTVTPTYRLHTCGRIHYQWSGIDKMLQQPPAIFAGGGGQYIDPFEFFFGSPFGQQPRRQQPQQQGNEKMRYRKASAQES